MNSNKIPNRTKNFPCPLLLNKTNARLAAIVRHKKCHVLRRRTTQLCAVDSLWVDSSARKNTFLIPHRKVTNFLINLFLHSTSQQIFSLCHSFEVFQHCRQHHGISSSGYTHNKSLMNNNKQFFSYQRNFRSLSSVVGVHASIKKRFIRHSDVLQTNYRAKAGKSF